MHKVWMTVAVLVLLIGCSSKKEKLLMENFESDKSYHKQLLKSEKIQLYEDNITKVMITATYINEQTIDRSVKNDERFIIGVYMEDQESSLWNGDYNLTLKKKEPISVEPLEKGSELLKDISFTSEWSQFYLVTFPYSKKSSFKLKLKSVFYGKGELHFAKSAKYKFNKKKSIF